MEFDFNRHSRRTIRLKGYDYSKSGMYFITLCTLNRECLFGRIHNNKIILTPAGKIVQHEWLHTPMVRKDIELDAFIIMPNHLHGIIFKQPRRGDPAGRPEDIADMERAFKDRATHRVAPTLKPDTIGSIIGQFKSISTKKIREKELSGFYWQRNYFEHIIRDRSELENTRKYIGENPIHWQEDQDNPINI